MAVPVVLVSEALQVAMNILQLVRAQKDNTPIPREIFEAVVAGRDDALKQLDADIAKAKAEGR